MPVVARCLLSAAGAALLVAPVVPVVPAAPVVAVVPAPSAATASGRAPSAAAPDSGRKVRIRLSRSWSHAGQPGVMVTAHVKGGAGGRVAFSQDGTGIGTEKVRRGKASLRLPSTNAPGVYTVRARWRGTADTARVTVHDSSLTLSAVSFRASRSVPSYQQSALSGSVVFKGAQADDGFVDIYEDGNVEGGKDGIDYCCMAPVADDGTFVFGGWNFLARVVEEKQPGTYSYTAFYTDGPGFDDYVHSVPITVTVIP